MTYFVTGATGFIGRHRVEELLEREGASAVIHVLVRAGSRARPRWTRERAASPRRSSAA